jgi:hypothetical protein
VKYFYLAKELYTQLKPTNAVGLLRKQHSGIMCVLFTPKPIVKLDLLGSSWQESSADQTTSISLARKKKSYVVRLVGSPCLRDLGILLDSKLVFTLTTLLNSP